MWPTTAEASRGDRRRRWLAGRRIGARVTAATQRSAARQRDRWRCSSAACGCFRRCPNRLSPGTPARSRVCYSCRAPAAGPTRTCRVCLSSRRRHGTPRARRAGDRGASMPSCGAFEHWVRTYAESAIPALRAGPSSASSWRSRGRRPALHPVPTARGDLRRLSLRLRRARRGVCRSHGEPGRRRAHGDRSPTPPLRAYFERTREQLGVASCPSRTSRRAAPPRAGQGGALVADRVIGGAGARCSCSVRRPACRGPAILAAESGAVHLSSSGANRLGRWSARRSSCRPPRARGARGSPRSWTRCAVLEETVGRAGAMVVAALPDLGGRSRRAATTDLAPSDDATGARRPARPLDGVGWHRWRRGRSSKRRSAAG